MNSYTAKGSVNEIQGNISFLQGEWLENSSANNISDFPFKISQQVSFFFIKFANFWYINMFCSQFDANLALIPWTNKKN